MEAGLEAPERTMRGANGDEGWSHHIASKFNDGAARQPKEANCLNSSKAQSADVSAYKEESGSEEMRYPSPKEKTAGVKRKKGQTEDERRSKHRQVEQNRRETTKALLNELQGIIPNNTGSDNPNINEILLATHEYLRSLIQITDKAPLPVTPQHMVAKRPSMADALIGGVGAFMHTAKRNAAGKAKYLCALECAPLGVISCGSDGCIVTMNEAASAMLLTSPIAMRGVSLITLTALHHRQLFMQVAGHLASGLASRVPFTNDMVRSDGRILPVFCEMQCLRKNGATIGLCEVMRPLWGG